MRMFATPAAAAALLSLGLAAQPAAAQIRNAPAPRALEFAAYIFAASNVCGYRIGTDTFEALLVKQGTRSADVSPRGPFGGRVQSMFALMSNDMAQHREKACLAVAGEYGPEGTVAKDVLLPAAADAPPASADTPAPPAPAPKPAQ